MGWDVGGAVVVSGNEANSSPSVCRGQGVRHWNFARMIAADIKNNGLPSAIILTGCVIGDTF